MIRSISRSFFVVAMSTALCGTNTIAQDSNPPRSKTGEAPEADAEKAAPKVRVQLRHRAIVPGLKVRLDDCASIHSTDEMLARSLGGVELGRAPRGTWSRTLQRTEIVEALERRGVRRERLSIEGERECEIFASTVRITAEDFVRSAEGVLREMLDAEGELDAEWTIQTRVRPLLVPRGRKSRRLRAEASNGRIAKSSAMIRIDVLVDEKPWTAISVAFRVQRFRNVLVTKKSFRAGQPLNPGDLAMQRVDISRKQFPPIDDISQLAGRVAARRIRSGETLLLSDLRRPAVVRKKDNVTVVAKVGRVRVARNGVALSDGGMGDRIAVQLDPKKPPISAEVVAPGLLIIPSLQRVTRGGPLK